MNLVLSEKDSYIYKLEKELNEIRLENEKIKDRLIVYELENLGKVNQNVQPNFNQMFTT